VFYVTVYVEADQLSIHFMFMGQQQRLTREEIADLLRVRLEDDSIHYLAYLTLRLLVVLTHLCYPLTTRSASCSCSHSFPVLPGL
jgi:hypothetical protein